jgi:hypothetical protein
MKPNSQGQKSPSYAPRAKLTLDKKAKQYTKHQANTELAACVVRGLTKPDQNTNATPRMTQTHG